jgi:hypothetical protein
MFGRAPPGWLFGVLSSKSKADTEAVLREMGITL